jgi:hypothetical protein
MTDCEWIITSQNDEERREYFRQTYGINIDMAWKVFRNLSMRYADVLDWHSSVRTILTPEVFEHSRYKKNFDKLFKTELSLWTLGWVKDDWKPKEAFKTFLDSHGEKGVPLYRWLEADFQSTYAQHMASENQVCLEFRLSSSFPS